MSERYLHENIYRGSSAMGEIREACVALCGVGAIGSNLAVNLVRQGFSSLVLIDHDRVEHHNLGTQVWSELEVGLPKVECLRNRLFDELGMEVEIIPKELTAKNAKKLLKGPSVLVDSFDNTESRMIVKEYSYNTGLPCLHVGLNADYAEVIWNEVYSVPSEKGQDVCDYPLARNLIIIAVSVASESLIRYVTKGKKSCCALKYMNLSGQINISSAAGLWEVLLIHPFIHLRHRRGSFLFRFFRN